MKTWNKTANYPAIKVAGFYFCEKYCLPLHCIFCDFITEKSCFMPYNTDK